MEASIVSPDTFEKGPADASTRAVIDYLLFVAVDRLRHDLMLFLLIFETGSIDFKLAIKGYIFINFKAWFNEFKNCNDEPYF